MRRPYTYAPTMPTVAYGGMWLLRYDVSVNVRIMMCAQSTFTWMRGVLCSKARLQGCRCIMMGCQRVAQLTWTLAAKCLKDNLRAYTRFTANVPCFPTCRSCQLLAEHHRSPIHHAELKLPTEFHANRFIAFWVLHIRVLEILLPIRDTLDFRAFGP